MKIRFGFVSNSSSSSYTCVVCGETYSGWDMSLSDCEMVQCVSCGSDFCEDEMLGSLTDEQKDKIEEDGGDSWRYKVPQEFCPICQLSHILETDMLAYLMKKHSVREQELKDEIKNQFKTRVELYKYLHDEKA